jgi:hypothetical protein
MRRSRKLREAAVSLTKTWPGPGVGMALDSFVRSETLEALEGMVHAAFSVMVVIWVLYVLKLEYWRLMECRSSTYIFFRRWGRFVIDVFVIVVATLFGD